MMCPSILLILSGLLLPALSSPVRSLSGRQFEAVNTTADADLEAVNVTVTNVAPAAVLAAASAASVNESDVVFVEKATSNPNSSFV